MPRLRVVHGRPSTTSCSAVRRMDRFSLGRRCLPQRVCAAASSWYLARSAAARSRHASSRCTPIRPSSAVSPPQRQQFVGERVPHRQGFTHRLDARVVPAPSDALADLADRLPPDHLRLLDRRGIALGKESQPVRVRSEHVEQRERGVPIPRTGQPGDREQRGLLRDPHPVGAAVQQRGQLGQACVGEVVGEQRAPFGRYARPLCQVEFVLPQGPAAPRPCRWRSHPGDLGCRPGRQAGDRRAGADRERAAGHAAQDAGPAAEPRLRALAGLGVLVLGRGGERACQLIPRVAGADLHGCFVLVHCQRGGLRPRALRVRSPVLC